MLLQLLPPHRVFATPQRWNATIMGNKACRINESRARQSPQHRCHQTADPVHQSEERLRGRLQRRRRLRPPSTAAHATWWNERRTRSSSSVTRTSLNPLPSPFPPHWNTTLRVAFLLVLRSAGHCWSCRALHCGPVRKHAQAASHLPDAVRPATGCTSSIGVPTFAEIAP